MNKKEMLEVLKNMWNTFDDLQEEDIAQKDEELMCELGEAMGSIDNAIDILEDQLCLKQIQKN